MKLFLDFETRSLADLRKVGAHRYARLRTMKPMFSYYGAKYRSAIYYRPPRFDTVIEPFAGSACYSLFWEPKQVILIDSDPVIYSVWHYLINATQSEILKLPIEFDSVDDLDVCDGAKYLLGFWIAKGHAKPARKWSAWGRFYRSPHGCKVWGAGPRERIAKQVPKIRHWQALLGDYRDAPDVKGHWFVDPPYQTKGRHYAKNAVDYADLARYVWTRRGFVQVCEQDGANWLPFTPFHTTRSRKGNSKEVLYETFSGL